MKACANTAYMYRDLFKMAHSETAERWDKDKRPWWSIHVKDIFASVMLETSQVAFSG